MFPIETTSLRKRPWPAFLILAIGIGIFLIPGNQKQNVPVYIGVGFILLSILIFILISKSEIIVDDTGITHKNLFTTKEIAWANISRTYLKSEHHGKSRRLYWFFEDLRGKKSKLQVDLLSRKNLRILAEAVTMKCPSSDIEKRIYDMAEGQFPWYIW